MSNRNKHKVIKPREDEDRESIEELDKFEFRPGKFYKELQDSHRNYNFRLNSDAMHTEVDNEIQRRFKPNFLLPSVRPTT